MGPCENKSIIDMHLKNLLAKLMHNRRKHCSNVRSGCQAQKLITINESQMANYTDPGQLYLLYISDIFFLFQHNLALQVVG